jgi:YesN/AraC family two-component response regulator
MYAYKHDIDVIELFTEEYSYNDYMDGFKNTQALRDSISYIIPVITSFAGEDYQKNDVQRAKKYILNNISQNLSVKSVADYVHLSPEYFTKLFKKEVGQNIKNYILQVKVDVAKDLLGNHNIPISIIALDLGYSNFSHFTQMFKKFENVTPTEYRNNLLEQKPNN